MASNSRMGSNCKAALEALGGALDRRAREVEALIGRIERRAKMFSEAEPRPTGDWPGATPAMLEHAAQQAEKDRQAVAAGTEHARQTGAMVKQVLAERGQRAAGPEAEALRLASLFARLDVFLAELLVCWSAVRQASFPEARLLEMTRMAEVERRARGEAFKGLDVSHVMIAQDRVLSDAWEP